MVNQIDRFSGKKSKVSCFQVSTVISKAGFFYFGEREALLFYLNTSIFSRKRIILQVSSIIENRVKGDQNIRNYCQQIRTKW